MVRQIDEWIATALRDLRKGVRVDEKQNVGRKEAQEHSIPALKAPPIFCGSQNRTRMLPKAGAIKLLGDDLINAKINTLSGFWIQDMNLQNFTHMLRLPEIFESAADVRKSKICSASYIDDWCGFKPYDVCMHLCGTRVCELTAVCLMKAKSPSHGNHKRREMGEPHWSLEGNRRN